MATVAPPARTELSDTYPNPSDAVARVGFGKLYDYVINLLGTLGTQVDARTALGAAASGANSDLTTISTLTGFGNGSSAHVLVSVAGNVGLGGTPNGTALLDLQSTTKGFKGPIMTTTQRNAITNTEALLVWDSTVKKYSYNNGTAWSYIGNAAAGANTDITTLGAITIADFQGSYGLLKTNGSESMRTKEGTAYGVAQILTDAATITCSMSLGQIVSVTLGGNRVMAAPTNLVDKAFYSYNVIQDGTGNRTLAWNSVFKFTGAVAPTLSTTASAKDYITFISDGTNLYEQGRSLGVA